MLNAEKSGKFRPGNFSIRNDDCSAEVLALPALSSSSLLTALKRTGRQICCQLHDHLRLERMIVCQDATCQGEVCSLVVEQLLRKGAAELRKVTLHAQVRKLVNLALVLTNAF